MFASIPKFMDFFTDEKGLEGLKVLNQIVTEFDKVSNMNEKYEYWKLNRFSQMCLKALFNHTDVEKIKVIGSTYMAACGLEVQDTGRLSATSMVPSDNEYVLKYFRIILKHNGINSNFIS